MECLRLTSANFKLAGANPTCFSGSSCYFTIHKSILENQTETAWESQNFNNPDDFKMIINPKILSIDGIKDEKTTMYDVSS